MSKIAEIQHLLDGIEKQNLSVIPSHDTTAFTVYARYQHLICEKVEDPLFHLKRFIYKLLFASYVLKNNDNVKHLFEKNPMFAEEIANMHVIKHKKLRVMDVQSIADLAEADAKEICYSSL